MNRLGFVLALYAAGMATWLLLRPTPVTPGATTAPTAVLADAPQARFDRRVMTDARTFLRSEIKPVLGEVEARFGRLQELQDRMGDELQRAQELAEAIKRAHQGQAGTLQEALAAIHRTGLELKGAVAKQKRALAELAARVQTVESRPAVVVAPADAGARDRAPTEPTRPQRPPFPSDEDDRPDPAELRAKLIEARANLQAEALGRQVLGIEAMRKHRVMDAVPRLIEIVASSPHAFARQAAAAALGELFVTDAVRALAEALIDSDVLLAQQAYRSLRLITTYDPVMSPTARIRERRKARGAMLSWWRTNEATVRERLGQPAGAGSS